MSIDGKTLHAAYSEAGSPPQAEWSLLRHSELDRWERTARTIKHKPIKGFAHDYLYRLVETISLSGDPNEPFFYLGGPMTGIPQFNFPRFHEVAERLRGAGYNIVSPAELDDPDTEKAALESKDGAPGSGAANGESYEDFLARDLVIAALPTCVGMIVMEGWERSRGARGESWVIGFLKKQMYEYRDIDGKPALTLIERDERLRELGLDPAIVGSVPKDAPGVLTQNGVTHKPFRIIGRRIR